MIASLVEKGHVFADVGTDHAHIPSYLLLNGISPYGYAGDIKKGPLAVAKKNLTDHGVEDKVDLVLCDGLKGFPLNKIDDIIIAGMGGDTIIGILNECDHINEDHRLILQPMTNVSKVREYLFNNGFSVETEKIVAEDDKIYNILVSYRRKTDRETSLKDIYFGVNISSTELMDEYIDFLKKKHLNHYNGLIKAKIHNNEETELEKSIIEMLENIQ